jgi:rhodanese-related sulfurtransferase
MSAVIKIAPVSASESVAYLQHKLAYYTDAWDLAEDLAQGITTIVVIDARSDEAYQAGHICGALSFPHRTMNAESTAHLDRSKVYITYCDGIGCNGSTKAALKLASLGFQVKELIGGLDFWKRDGHPMAWGAAAGEWPLATPAANCGC